MSVLSLAVIGLSSVTACSDSDGGEPAKTSTTVVAPPVTSAPQSSSVAVPPPVSPPTSEVEVPNPLPTTPAVVEQPKQTVPQEQPKPTAPAEKPAPPTLPDPGFEPHPGY